MAAVVGLSASGLRNMIEEKPVKKLIATHSPITFKEGAEKQLKAFWKDRMAAADPRLKLAWEARKMKDASKPKNHRKPSTPEKIYAKNADGLAERIDAMKEQLVEKLDTLSKAAKFVEQLEALVTEI